MLRTLHASSAGAALADQVTPLQYCLKVAPERVISNLAEYGNTSAASIPLALDEAVRGGSIQAGDTVRTNLHLVALVSCCGWGQDAVRG